MDNLKLIKFYFREHLASLVMGVATLTLCNLLQMTFPRLVGWAIDILGSGSEDRARILSPVLWIIGLAVSVAILRYIWRRNIYGFARLMERDLRASLYSRFVELSLNWHQENSSGELMALSTNDVEAVRMAVGYGFVSLVDAVVLGLTAIVFMLTISPQLCLLAFVPLPFITIMAVYFNRKIFKRVLVTQNIFGDLTEVVREHIAGFKIIRAMGLEELARSEVREKSREFVRANISLAIITGLFFPLLYLFTNISLSLTIYFGGKSVILGTVTAGGFVAFITYLTLITWPLMALGITMGRLSQGLASLRRLSKVIGVEERSVHPLTQDFECPQDFDIEFKELSFSYPESEKLVLKDLSLKLPKGVITALTGPTGSGKTTIASLIMGLREPKSGLILIGGRDSKDYSLAGLRSLFAYVPQDGYIFSGTLYQNIAFGKPNAPEEEVMAAAESAWLHMDRDIFPEGLYTLVGEKGLTLSGGQRQRVALARALLMDPPYLILDDTLSAVDAHVEDRILTRLKELRKDKGTLIISHRLMSLTRADRILVVEDGRLTQEGTSTELESQEGYFKRIHTLATLNVKKEEILAKTYLNPSDTLMA
ncbi:MAG: ABC transporter ATP-binding protein/permease [Deltaproteobacteria bacterium]|jgi:ATP-binding cassette subfamily B protein|nr:ABC transporter ATP-binding protein/permease [Deltaproteobacteria bacterium]